MAVQWSALTDGDDMTINSTSWVTATWNTGANADFQGGANEAYHIQVEYVVDGTTPTDTFECQVITDTGIGTPEYDTIPVLAFAMDNTPGAGNPNRRSFTISGYYNFRVQGRLTGSTDSTTFKVSFRKATLS